MKTKKVPANDSDFATLARHRHTWRQKPLLREIYERWYVMMMRDCRRSTKPTLELGAGGGNLKEFFPFVVATDIVPCPWLDACFDAQDMPFAKNSVANCVLVDVLHHIADPVRFLHEAHRVLEPGGRVVMLEPYPSAFSLPLYRRFHPEPFVFDIDYFSPQKVARQKRAWDSNQAIPYLLFYKHLDQFQRVFGAQFRIVQKKRLSFFVYPLSGGFERAALLPTFLFPLVEFIEWLVTPLAPFLAFRTYIVLEKIV